jgi:hypothetical protein
VLGVPTRKKKSSFLHEHSLSLVAAGFLILWVILYAVSDPETHLGVFYGNSVADWTGVLIMVVGTKYLFEKGSKESKPVHGRGGKLHRFVVEHSMSIVLVTTGSVWAFVYSRVEPAAKWGQVVGNVLSEWVQILGLLLLTKGLFERGSEESKRRG